MEKYILIISMHADPAMPPGYDEWGGTHTYMKELLDCFAEKKISCILITRRSMEQLPYQEQYNSYCKIIRLTNGQNIPEKKQKLQYYHKENVASIIDIIQATKSKPEVIHSVYWYSGRIALDISNSLNIPYVHSVISNAKGRIMRGATETVKDRALYEEKIYKNAKKILAVSHDEKDDLVKLYGIESEKIIVSGQYIDSSFLYPAHDANGFPKINSTIATQKKEKIAINYNKTLKKAISNEHFWLYKAFTYLGRIDVNKGIVQIVKAWYILYKENKEICPPLWLVGGSIYEIENIRKELSLIIDDLDDLEKKLKIVWWGYLTAEGLSTVLLKSLVLITHSLYEPGGRVAVEAMTQGVPVIATPYGFAKDIIKNWENGFLIKHNDINELTKKMSLFVRQPLLSNSLGLNAEKTAKNVILTWNFLDEHLKAYGLDVIEFTTSDIDESKYYKNKFVNIYPYHNIQISNSYIKKLFMLFCSEEIIDFKKLNTDICSSEIKEIITKNNKYVVKRLIQRLASSPIFNPLSADILIRDKDKHYNIEINIYKRLKPNVFIGADEFHNLIFLKKLEPIDFNNKDYLSKCLHYLYHRKNILNKEEKNKYLEIYQSKFDDLSNIVSYINKLEASLPDFYFECSGMFDNTISWKIAKYLIHYNNQFFTSNLKTDLKELANFFGTIDYKINYDMLRDINLDIELRHLMLQEDELFLIDHEKTSIGIIELDIAAFLYNYYCTYESMHINIKDFYQSIKNKLDNYSLNTLELLSAIAYRFFYNIIVSAVLNSNEDNKHLNDLKILKILVEDVNNEITDINTSSR